MERKRANRAATLAEPPRRAAVAADAMGGRTMPRSRIKEDPEGVPSGSGPASAGGGMHCVVVALVSSCGALGVSVRAN